MFKMFGIYPRIQFPVLHRTVTFRRDWRESCVQPPKVVMVMPGKLFSVS